jgi:hypothetical protein
MISGLKQPRALRLRGQDRLEEAHALCLKYRGQQDVQDNKSWEAIILEDFADFQKAGLAHPLMQEIEKVLDFQYLRHLLQCQSRHPFELRR